MRFREVFAMKITTKYQENMRFASDEAVPTVMDASVEGGGKGEASSPKQTVLHGLAGCTGMDVAMILQKKKVPFRDFSIDVEAELTRYHPKVFKSIKITYRIAAAQKDLASIERAVELSRENFCGVSAMLEKTASIEHEIILTPVGE
jgi:putative redox protein